MYQTLIPEEIRDALRVLPTATLLTVETDGRLGSLPWELSFDGSMFLCLKFACGRPLGMRRLPPGDRRDILKLLIIADPTGDLPGTQAETNYIMGQLRGFPQLRMTRFGTEIRKRRFLELFSSGKYDLIHYSGHSQCHPTDPRKNQLTFLDGACYGYEIEGAESQSPPALMFANSCQSAGTSAGTHETGLASIAGSFLRAGVAACIGALWVVMDMSSGMLASDFYRSMLYGSPIGEALRRARSNSFRKWGYTDDAWASFILYGDPDTILLRT
jgi:CHAT domain-containing protein